jgi:ATP-binding cassette, subfamily F, member 3
LYAPFSHEGDEVADLIVAAARASLGLSEEGNDVGNDDGNDAEAELSHRKLGQAVSLAEREAAESDKLSTVLAAALPNTERSSYGISALSADGDDGMTGAYGVAGQVVSKRTARNNAKIRERQVELRRAADAEMAEAARVVSSIENNQTRIDSSGIRLERFCVASKARGGGDLVTGASLHLVPGRRYALVGRNGTGKTTMLEALAAPPGSERGIEGFPAGVSVLHVKQEIVGDSKTPLEFVVMSDGTRTNLLTQIEAAEATGSGGGGSGGVLEAKKQDDKHGEELARLFEALERHDERLGDPNVRARSILQGLGFDDELLARPTSRLSGGWRMRVALACALFISPAILLLDEPTNHLDLEAVFWLTNFLNGKTTDSGATRDSEQIVVAVSHDRTFLDDIATDVVLIERNTLSTFHGNFSGFLQTRENEKIRQQRARKAQEAKREHLQEFITKHAQAGHNGMKDAAQRKSRMKKLERLGMDSATGKKHKISYDGDVSDVEEVSELTADFEVTLPDPGVVDGYIVTCDQAGFRYDSKSAPIFSGLDLQIDVNSRIGILGKNGAGKSTLVRMLLGENRATEGTCDTAQFARIAYLEQHTVEMLDPYQTPLEALLEIYPGDRSDGHITRARGYLATFGLGGDKLPEQQIMTLSGGQRFRICLALICFPKPHLLFLDEPTNHLDLETLESLTAALKEFRGGLVIVSHDASLLSEVCKDLLTVEDGRVNRWTGSFKQYAEERRRKLE